MSESWRNYNISTLPQDNIPEFAVTGNAEFKKNVDIEGNLILDGINIIKYIKEIKEENNSLKLEIEQMKQKLEEIYYAPGMPGFYIAQTNFDNLSKKRKIN